MPLNLQQEESRLRDLEELKISYNTPDAELDDLVEIASAICDTPISLLSFVGVEQLWFKARHGAPLSQMPRSQSFCQYALHRAEEVMVVDDPVKDDRFKNSPLVVGDPHIRFYAGAPLQTSAGNVIGTLCVIDNKSRKISEAQKKSLKLVAKKIMHHLETKKLLLEKEDLLETSARKLKKLSDQAPGAIFQLEMTLGGKLYFPFISKGFSNIHPGLDMEELRINAESAFHVVHPDDVVRLKESLKKSFNSVSRWNEEYRVIGDGNETWHWVNAKPEKREDGTVVWYGTFQEINERKEYIDTLEKIIFDISHVMRRPVSSLLGLTQALQDFQLDRDTFRELISRTQSASEEMDIFIRKLNDDYTQIRNRVTGSGIATDM